MRSPRLAPFLEEPASYARAHKPEVAGFPRVQPLRRLVSGFEPVVQSRGMALGSGSPLGLDPELMRQLGYRTIDMLVDRVSGPAGPVVSSATPEELQHRLAMPPPEDPVAFDEILEGLERDVLPFVARISHPGYLAFIPGEGTWPGALGDLIASALNIDTCWWLGASGPSALELVVLDWLRQWVGC